MSAPLSPRLRMLDQALARQIAFCERRDLPLNLLSLYLANFTDIAGEEGHVITRRMQTLLTAEIEKIKRAEDWLCAWGDGRLVFALPDTPPRGARRLAMRLVQQIGHHGFRLQGRLLRFDVRIGLHTVDDEPRQDPRKLIMRTLHTASHGAETISASRQMILALQAPAPAFSHDRHQDSPTPDILPNDTSTPQKLRQMFRELNEEERMALVDELLLASSR
ncbi:diguanylate cyclase domain-containing protein [Isoalcanivorax indicus]|uniref:diguanylate cyclase domain-containing protein n=1 Tax=Isoalcanivorax indicus TaxID=2202653 RepID=UPI0013C4A15C|nr:diguanylate cyclase [Isoalcanivorax indicus]